MKLNQHDQLLIGDLVKKKHPPSSGRFAIVADTSLEEYYDHNAWIRVAYADDLGGYEWVRREGLQKLSKCIR